MKLFLVISQIRDENDKLKDFQVHGAFKDEEEARFFATHKVMPQYELVSLMTAELMD